MQAALKQAALNISICSNRLVTHEAGVSVTVILFSVKVTVRVNVEDSRVKLFTVKPC